MRSEEFFERGCGREEFLLGQLFKGLRSEDSVQPGEGMLIPRKSVWFAMTGREKAREVLVAFAREAEEGELRKGESLQREIFERCSDDGADAAFERGVMSAGGTIKAHVIDDAERSVSEFRCTRDEILGQTGSA